MNDPIHLTVPAEEWDQVARLTAAACPPEGQAVCVWLAVERGQRRWFADADDAEWSIDGGGDDTEGRHLVPLPPRAVWFAAELAQIDGVAALAIDADGTILIEAPTAGSAAFDRPVRPQAAPVGGHGPIEATAEIASHHLLHLLAAATVIPPGAKLDELPDLWLAVEADHVVAAVDWRPHAGRSTFRVPAVATSGEASVALTSAALLTVLRRVAPTETSVILGIPGEAGHPLVVTGDGWTVLLGTVRRCLADHLDRVSADLRQVGWNVSRAEDDVLLVGGYGRRIRIAVFDDPVPIARVTTIVDEGIEPTADVLAQVNAANGRLANIRVWIEGDRVIAGTDVPVAFLDGIGATLEHLVASVDGYDVVLGGLAEAS